MKLFSLIVLLVSNSISFAQDAPIYQFNTVNVFESFPSMGEGKMKRVSKTIETYVHAIKNDDYAKWYATFSDSTISRVAPHKFPQKFRRMKEYGISNDTVNIIKVTELNKAFQNEIGTEYEVILEFKDKLDVSNRVSFDKLKRTKGNKKSHLVAINVIVIGKESFICVHKYNGAQTHENGNNE